MKTLSFKFILFGLFIVYQNAVFAEDNHKISLGSNSTIEASGSSVITEENGHKKEIADILHSGGQLIVELVKFNNQPAILNWATASRIKQIFHYTLKIENNEVLVDCVYGSLYDSGIVMHKAICGINQKLDSNYADLVNLIPDFDTDHARTIVADAFGKKLNTPIIISREHMGKLFLYIRYENLDAFNDYQYENLVSDGKQTVSLGDKTGYLVYLADAPTEIARIEMTQDEGEGESFKSYTYDSLLKLISS